MHRFSVCGHIISLTQISSGKGDPGVFRNIRQDTAASMVVYNGSFILSLDMLLIALQENFSLLTHACISCQDNNFPMNKGSLNEPPIDLFRKVRCDLVLLYLLVMSLKLELTGDFSFSYLSLDIFFTILFMTWYAALLGIWSP